MSNILPEYQAVIFALYTKNAILLERRPRDSSYCPGLWVIPGGKILPGEWLVEETDIHIHPGRWRLVSTCHVSNGIGAFVSFCSWSYPRSIESPEGLVFEWWDWPIDMSKREELAVSAIELISLLMGGIWK